MEPTFEVTVLTRVTSSYSPPMDVDATALNNLSIVKTNLGDHEALVRAFKGQDAVILTITASLEAESKRMIDAAVEAGVKWIMPSNFGK